MGGHFKGFALLRQFASSRPYPPVEKPVDYTGSVAPCVYKPGTGLIPLAVSPMAACKLDGVDIASLQIAMHRQIVTYRGQPSRALRPTSTRGTAIECLNATSCCDGTLPVDTSGI